jgi:hypothetical protein
VAKGDTSLHEAMQEAARRYAAMTPEQQADMWRKQRESWVRAFTTPCEHGELDFEQCPECRK